MRDGDKLSIGVFLSADVLYNTCIATGNQDFNKTNTESVVRDQEVLDHQLREVKENWR